MYLIAVLSWSVGVVYLSVYNYSMSIVGGQN